MAKPKTQAAASKKPSSSGGKALKVPDDIYEDLQRLQGVYPGMTLMEIAAMKLREGLKGDQQLLEQLRAMQRTPPKDPVE